MTAGAAPDEMQAHQFLYQGASGAPVVVGRYDPPGRPPCWATVHVTRDRETAERWLRDLAEGSLPRG